MKKVFLVIALFVGFIGFSQEDTAYKADALKLVKLQSLARMEGMLEPLKARIPAEKQDAFIKEVKAAFPALFDKTAELAMESYTHDEIKQILDFYASPIGLRVLEETPVMTEKMMAFSTEWGRNTLGPIIMKYMQ